MAEKKELFRGDDVKILINHHGRINPEFFNKEGIICGIETHNKITTYKVLVQAVGIEEFREVELEKI